MIEPQTCKPVPHQMDAHFLDQLRGMAMNKFWLNKGNARFLRPGKGVKEVSVFRNFPRLSGGLVVPKS